MREVAHFMLLLQALRLALQTKTLSFHIAMPPESCPPVRPACRHCFACLAQAQPHPPQAPLLQVCWRAPNLVPFVPLAVLSSLHLLSRGAAGDSSGTLAAFILSIALLWCATAQLPVPELCRMPGMLCK